MSIQLSPADIPLPKREADVSLDIVREALRTLLATGEMVECPCCGGVSKVYARGIHAAMVRGLIKVASSSSGLPPSAFSREEGGDFAKLTHWGLIEQTKETGAWAITNKGRRWLSGEITIPHKVLLYGSEVLGFDHSKLIHASDVKKLGVDLGDILASWGPKQDAAE